VRERALEVFQRRCGFHGVVVVVGDDATRDFLPLRKTTMKSGYGGVKCHLEGWYFLFRHWIFPSEKNSSPAVKERE
jgi:hypothetical protein